MTRRYVLSIFVFFSFLLGFSFSLAGQGVVDTMAVKREVDSLINIAYDLSDKSDYERAQQANERAKKKALDGFGEESALHARCLYGRGVIYYNIGMYKEAEEDYLTARKITSKVLGENNLEYAKIINSLGILYSDQGDNKKAEPFYLETKSILEKTVGKKHPNYAACLNNLAILYREMGEYANSEGLYMEAISIKENTLGKEHPDYALSLDNLAFLYFEVGNYEKSEPLYIEALQIRDKTIGKENTIYAGNLINLGSLYSGMGKFEKSELVFLEAKNIFEDKLKNYTHPFYMNCMFNLAILYMRMGQYEKSEAFFLKAKSIGETILGKEHPGYSYLLEGIGALYRDMGQFDKAELYDLESKLIREKTLGKNHPDYARSVHNLAVLYMDIGQYEEAELLYLESLEIWEKTLGKKHLDFILNLSNLAIVYSNTGRYEKAEALFLESKNIREQALGKEHPDYAMSLNNLAILYQKTENYEKSESFCLISKEIREKVLGREHPDYASSLDNLKAIYTAMGNYEKASIFYEELIFLNQFLLTKSLSHLSDRELNNYTQKFFINRDQFLSFVSLTSEKVTHLTPIAIDNTLFHKGFLLQAASQVKRLALTDSTSTEKYYTLKGYHRRLAAQYALPIADRDSALVADLEEKANTLEKDLVHTVAGYGEAIRQVKWQEVRQALKKDEAAIEFVHYRYYDQKARATDSTMYAALILLPTDTAPHFVPLCEARQLEAIFNQPKQKEDLYYQNIYSVDAEGKAPLYQILWAPLEPYLKDVKTIYYSPSGLLHRLNPGAIQPARRETLGDRYHLVELGSTRSLVVPSGYQPAAKDAVLFGGIRYEMDSTKIAQANADFAADLAARGSGGFAYTDSTLRGGNWKYLPATAKEITVTDSILQKHGFHTTVRRDYAATEEALLSIGQGKTSPRVLHIATHGFFFPDPKSTVDGRRSTVDGGEPVFKISDNPMIRSGLLLAGANHAWKTGKPLRPGMEDGILTAYEISQMNLRNTELVVLSACETGLGDIQGNEGVYGLQRAFKIAGAKYLLMSLWSVPDKHTRELMEEFYKNWLDGGKSIPVAFREAQKMMRGKYANPFYWAGFVLIE